MVLSAALFGGLVNIPTTVRPSVTEAVCALLDLGGCADPPAERAGPDPPPEPAEPDVQDVDRGTGPRGGSGPQVDARQEPGSGEEIGAPLSWDSERPLTAGPYGPGHSCSEIPADNGAGPEEEAFEKTGYHYSRTVEFDPPANTGWWVALDSTKSPDGQIKGESGYQNGVDKAKVYAKCDEGRIQESFVPTEDGLVHRIAQGHVVCPHDPENCYGPSLSVSAWGEGLYQPEPSE
ncbi:hypothetical protein [Murinocardiopsis flavida]|uniref:hypothetical protein n=1 Tax=Murinocardiopsis flavida TaxID=645275 RepID=UPI000D0CFFDF|nr:hypothetical protein [Murinocardiopsis flavida]